MALTGRPTAVVMNMSYTGLGIARSLGEMGIPVIGLTSERGIYGNFSRYARTRFCPDSKRQPDQLLAYLIQLGKALDHPGIIFPTRDHDLVFLDQYRAELTPWFSLVLPESSVLDACLNKWQTYQWAQRSGIPAPKSWLIENELDLRHTLDEITYPCVLKPVAAHQWRTCRNWALVGRRKAIPIYTQEELLAEYAAVASADKCALAQEMIPGGDNYLVTTSCYFDSTSNCVAAFNTRKLAQSPEGFGTGCIVQADSHPELLEPTIRLLRDMRFTGIAEVEYKWNAAKQEYQLIEINPRPWDQHRLGVSCGVNLMYLAYCEHAGLPRPVVEPKQSQDKWVAEDVFVLDAIWWALRRDPKCSSLLRLAKGRRIYAIWSARDPLPLIAYFGLRFLPQLLGMGLRSAWSALTRSLRRPKRGAMHKGIVHSSELQRGDTHG